MKLSTEQKNVIAASLNDIKKKQVVKIGGYAGTGKAQPLDSLVVTPTGCVRMGDIKEGSSVITPCGQVTKVTGVFPQGKKSIYRVWFSDGHSVECCDDHLWLVVDRRRLSNLKKYKTPEKVFPLSYIREYLTKSDGTKRFYIDTTEPVPFDGERVDIDPYLLGLLLGDGSIGDDNFAIHSNDEQIIENVEELLITWNCKLNNIDDTTYKIVSTHGKAKQASCIPLRREFRRLGLWNCDIKDKFIPSEYLNNSIDIRLAILQGLMDSDGTVDKRTGMAYFSTISGRLAADICFLIESLGGICGITGVKKWCEYKGERRYCDAFEIRVGLNETKSLFRLARKKKLAKNRTKYKTRRCIRSVEYVGEKEAQCIAVDHPRHLYLTDHFIPTHNTTIIRNILQAKVKFGVCAFTGKAANVLRKKHVPASTIHSMIYKPYEAEDGTVYFSLAPDLEYDAIIVDESSMVSQDIYSDLLSFNKPVIFVGDHGQLEPVGDKFNLMATPDYTLEEIHRNAGEIAHFADFIRRGFKPSAWEHQPGAGEKVKFLNKRQWKDYALKVDQIVCAFNKTRAEINIEVRQQLGYGDKPVVGDRVMCLRNHNGYGIFNGMQGVIGALSGKNKMRFDADGQSFDLFYDPSVFNQVKYDYSLNRDDPHPFDYCYGETCHKCQGDEWEKGLVIEQKCDLWSHVRWAYTAASRFMKEVYWVSA